MPPRPVALWTADWHAKRDDCIWGKRKEIAGDVAFGVQQVLELAEKYDVKVVGIAGDVTNDRMQFSTSIELLRRAMDAFQKSGRELWYVQGNHDIDTPPVLQAMHSWPVHLHGLTVMIPDTDIQVCGLDYQYPGQITKALEDLRDVEADILFTHQTWKDWMSEDTGHAWFREVPDQFSALITGDYHKHVSGTPAMSDLVTVSPGPLCMQRISECDMKGVYIMYDNFTFESVPLRTRGYHYVELMDEDTLERFLDEWIKDPARMPQSSVPAYIARNILRVWYNSEIPDAWKRIEARVSNDVHLFKTAVKPELAEVALDKKVRLQTIIDGGLAGCIEQFYGEDEGVKDDALWLLSMADPAEAVKALYKARLTEAISGEAQQEETQPVR